MPCSAQTKLRSPLVWETKPAFPAHNNVVGPTSTFVLTHSTFSHSCTKLHLIAPPITSTKTTPHVNRMSPKNSPTHTYTYTSPHSSLSSFKSPSLQSRTPSQLTNMDSSRSDLWTTKKKKRNQNPVLEGYVESEDQLSSRSVSRTVSLTDEDLDELKGCVDLGFGFNYEEIPELCGTLPALELCYSIQQKFLDDQHRSSSNSLVSGDDENVVDSDGGNESSSVATTASPIANWKISSPGDDPEEVKARLKFWAQAVACTVKLCS